MLCLLLLTLGDHNEHPRLPLKPGNTDDHKMAITNISFFVNIAKAIYLGLKGLRILSEQ